MTDSSKLVELDALRGIAALVVVCGHFAMNFTREFHDSLIGTPAFAAVNGPAAVILFFVLSGFVLTLRALERRDIEALGRAALKRWPRLAGPVAVAGIMYTAAANMGALPTPDAVGASGVETLPILTWGFSRQATDAVPLLWESAVGTFINGTAKYNDVLWTMHYEFVGSYIVFAMASIAVWVYPRTLRYASVAGLGILSLSFSPLMLCFMLGTTLAWAHVRFFQQRDMPAPLALLLIFCATVIFAVPDGGNFYGWEYSLGIPAQWIVAQSAAAVMAMCVVMYWHPARSYLGGNVGSFVGKLSFPIYLMHPLVLWSVTSWLYMEIAGSLHADLILFAITILASIAVSLPLARFDKWWVALIGRAFKSPCSSGRLISPEVSAAP